MTASRPTGRPERPVPPDSGALGELARELRRLRENDGEGLTYRELGDRLHYNPSALSRAASGVVKPSWAIVEAMVIELGGDLAKTKELWEQAVPVSTHVPEPRDGDNTKTQGGPADGGPRHARDNGDGRGESAAPGASGAPSAPPPRTSTGHRRWLLPFALILLVALLGAAMGATISRNSGGGGLPAGPSAAIWSPQSDVVAQTVHLSGTYENIPSGELVWAITEDVSDTKRFFPQDRACPIGGGRFDCGTYYVGKQEASDSNSYRILVVRANAAAVNVFVDYQIKKGGPQGPNPGLAILPEGAEVMAAKTVRRA